jgi:spermidine synthase
VIGLGVGTLAAYGRSADEYCFIEIDAEVERLARRYFSFLSDARCRIRCVTGDGRVWLQEHPEEQFDVLVLDAFSGDVIPTHLLTAEAWDLYWQRIRPGGFLAIHLSNIHFDLRPVINGHHQRSGFQMIYVDSPETLNHPRSLWAIVRREPFELTELPSDAPSGSPRVSWTDQWHPLWPLWRKGNQLQ